MQARLLCKVNFVAFIAAILLLGLTAVATHANVLQENSLLSAAKAASDKDDLLGVQAIEPKALALAAFDAHRDGDRLILRVRSGATKVYQDRPECKNHTEESKCQKYSLVAHARSRGVFVIAKLYYESAEYILVDDTSGDETTLRRFPIFSPEGDHVLEVIMNDEQLGFAVEVWHRQGRRFVLDWTGSPNVEGMYTSYKLLRWPSEDRIEMQSDSNFGPSKQRVTKRFELRHKPGGWEVVETP